MGIGDSVTISISLSSASTPTIPAFSIPLLAGYHNRYTDRARAYAGGAPGLAQMLLDGFTVNDALYRAASVLCSQSPTVNGFVIGRRALPPLQTLQLACIDGTVNDAYAFTLVGSDGIAHKVSYTNVINVGAAGSGTVSVTNGSANITFSGAQTFPKGQLFVFSSQPGVYYALSAAISSVTAGVLTGNYTGTTNAAATWTTLAPLAGTFNAVNGSATVASSASQVAAVLPGESIQFVSQLGTYYTVLSVSASTVTLTSPYTGTTNATTNASDVCALATAATAIQTIVAAFTNVGTATVVTNTIVQIARVDGLLTDVQGWLANGFQSLQLSDLTADPGIATDLAAIYQANVNGWYGLILDSNSAAEIKAAQVWVEATGVGGKFAFYNNSDWANVNTNSTTDLFSALHTSGYNKCHVQQNDQQLLCWAGASACAWALSKNVGTYVMAQGMALPGVSVDTDVTLPESWRIVLNTYTAANPVKGGKFGNFYASVAGISSSYWGMAPSGRFADLTIGIDWLNATMQADVFALLSGNPKIPYNDRGIGRIGDAVEARLVTAAGPAYGLVDLTLAPIVITKPSAASLTPAQRASRNLPNLSWSATVSNGIESVNIIGQLNQ